MSRKYVLRSGAGAGTIAWVRQGEMLQVTGPGDWQCHKRQKQHSPGCGDRHITEDGQAFDQLTRSREIKEYTTQSKNACEKAKACICDG